MPYAKESKEELVKLVEGKRLKVNIYGSDQYGHFVGDVYFNNIFIQVILSWYNPHVIREVISVLNRIGYNYAVKP